MGAGHGHKLHYHGHASSTGLPPTSRSSALVGFMLVVVATPQRLVRRLRRLDRRCS